MRISTKCLSLSFLRPTTARIIKFCLKMMRPYVSEILFNMPIKVFFVSWQYYGLHILICYIHFKSSLYSDYHFYFIKPWILLKRQFYWKADSNTKATVFELNFHWFRSQKYIMHFWSKFGNFDHSGLPLLNPLLAAFMANNLPWECDLHLSIFMNHFLICIYNCSSHMLAIICQWPKFVC